jgi:hypothetical protein
MRRILAILAFVTVFAAAFTAASQNSGAALLEQARAKKTAGDLQGAAEGFEKVLTDFAADRSASANALLELGAISESLDQRTRARSYYERLRKEYADQRAEVTTAANRIAELDKRSNPAAGAVGGANASRIVIKTPYTEDPYAFAISPDGKTIVFQATLPGGKGQLWRQAVDASAKPEPIAGSDGAAVGAYPFFSPDGKSIAYFAKQRLWQIDVAGGAPKDLADAPSPYGGTWSADGTIVISGHGVAAPLQGLRGGRLAPVTAGGGHMVSPRFVDDRRFLYFSRDNRGTGRLEIGAIDGSTLTGRALPAAHAGTYGRGFLFYVTQTGVLNAVRLDATNLTTSGTSTVVVDRVGKEDRFPGAAAVSVSAAGSIAYREAAIPKRQMVWMDRAGELVGSIGAPDAATPSGPRVSSDGRSVVMFRQAGVPLGSAWIVDTETGAMRQVRDGAVSPIWSPGGGVMYTALTTQNGPIQLLMFEQTAGPAAVALPAGRGGVAARGGPVRTFGPTTGAFPEDTLPNGSVLYRSGGATGGVSGFANPGDLFVLTPTGDSISVAQTEAAERSGRFSPDGAWIAYQSDASGRNEIYVQPFPGNTNQRQRVSLGGGTSPQWGRGGKELYFLSADSRLMVTGATPAADKTIEFTTPKPLFAAPLPQGAEYDTSRDGDRFLVLLPLEDSPPIIVLTNWAP